MSHIAVKKIDYKKLCVLFLSSFRKYKILKDNLNNSESSIIRTVKIIIIIDEGTKSGEVNENINSDKVTSLILSIYLGTLITWVTSDDSIYLIIFYTIRSFMGKNQ